MVTSLLEDQKLSVLSCLLWSGAVVQWLESRPAGAVVGSSRLSPGPSGTGGASR